MRNEYAASERIGCFQRITEPAAYNYLYLKWLGTHTSYMTHRANVHTARNEPQIS